MIYKLVRLYRQGSFRHSSVNEGIGRGCYICFEARDSEMLCVHNNSNGNIEETFVHKACLEEKLKALESILKVFKAYL